MSKFKCGYLLPHPPVLIPQIGGEAHAECSQTYRAMTRVSREIGEIKPQRIIIISPHGTVYRDAISTLYDAELKGDFWQFGEDDLTITAQNDLAFIDCLQSQLARETVLVKITAERANQLSADARLDHGALVPLYFINQHLTDYRVVHLNYGLLSERQLYVFGMSLRRAIEEMAEHTVVIASGDLSHALKDSGPYSYDPAGADFDRRICQAFTDANLFEIFTIPQLTRRAAAQCAFRSITILLGAYEAEGYCSELYSYQGPFGVGYAVAKIKPLGSAADSMLARLDSFLEKEKVKRQQAEDDYIKLARAAIKAAVTPQDSAAIDLTKFTIEDKKAGCFVTIKQNGELRGCIGTIEASCSALNLEIIRNAQEAALYDPRFLPLTAAEYRQGIAISVDVLNPPRAVNDIKQLDPQREGIIIRQADKSALLLPALDGVTTVDQQIEIAKRKAAISGESFELKSFTVQRHEVLTDG